MKCQGWNHFAKDCPAEKDTCGDEPSSSAGLYFRIFRTFNVTRHTRCHTIALANSYSYNIALAKSFPGSYLFFTAYFAFFVLSSHISSRHERCHRQSYMLLRIVSRFSLYFFLFRLSFIFLHCYFRIFANVIISLSRSLMLSRSSHSHFRTAQPFPNTSATAQPQSACYEESCVSEFYYSAQLLCLGLPIVLIVIFHFSLFIFLLLLFLLFFSLFPIYSI